MLSRLIKPGHFYEARLTSGIDKVRAERVIVVPPDGWSKRKRYRVICSRWLVKGRIEFSTEPANILRETTLDEATKKIINVIEETTTPIITWKGVQA